MVDFSVTDQKQPERDVERHTLDFMRPFYDLPENRLEELLSSSETAAPDRLAAIAAYFYRQPDDTGVKRFYKALESIEEIAFDMRGAGRLPVHDDSPANVSTGQDRAA